MAQRVQNRDKEEKVEAATDVAARTRCDLSFTFGLEKMKSVFGPVKNKKFFEIVPYILTKIEKYGIM